MFCFCFMVNLILGAAIWQFASFLFWIEEMPANDATTDWKWLLACVAARTPDTYGDGRREFSATARKPLCCLGILEKTNFNYQTSSIAYFSSFAPFLKLSSSPKTVACQMYMSDFVKWQKQIFQSFTALEKPFRGHCCWDCGALSAALWHSVLHFRSGAKLKALTGLCLCISLFYNKRAKIENVP